MKILGYIIGGVLSVFAVITLVLLLVTGDLWFYKTFAPKYEQARRDTFEQSKAFNDGMVQELDRMYLDYQKASKSEKEALASVALHRVANYDANRLPSHLRSWIESLRTGSNY